MFFLRLHLFHKTEVGNGWAGNGPGPGTGLANGMIPECSGSETEDPPMQGTAWPISPISQNQSAIKGDREWEGWGGEGRHKKHSPRYIIYRVIKKSLGKYKELSHTEDVLLPQQN